ncbi:MAG: GNAT family N-acetyltransferase [Phenylobacterium sp.]
MAETPPATSPVVMNPATHRFEAALGDDVAFAEYSLLHDAIVLPHTVVPEAFAGRGVASALAVAALTYARDHGLTVKPICPFMAGYIRKHPEWQDLVHKDFRAELGLPA